MAERSYSVRLLANVGQYLTSMATAASATEAFGKKANTSMVNAGRNMKTVGKSLSTYVSLPLAATGVAAAKFAIDWESSFAGVTKTVDGTAEQMATLEDGLRSMTKELPASHTEIAAVAEAAGQLGVGVEDIEDFTRVMVDLGETTNLSANEAATSLARFSNIMGTSGADVERIGSTIVELGNNSATTEAEIVTLGTRLAAAGKIAGLSESDVLAFASTLTSVGVEAEAGGTALSKVFTSIGDAVKTGGENLQTFATVAGVSAEQFTAAFEEDPANAVASFIDGLGRMNAAGESTSQVFDDLGLADQRLMRALLSTAEAQGMLTEQIEMGRDAFQDNTALADEAAKRYETMGAQLEMVWNQIKDALIDIGDAAMPLVMGIAERIGGLAEAFGKLPDGAKTAALAVGAVVAAIGPLMSIGGRVVEALGRIGVGFDDVGRASKTASKMIAGVGVALFAAVDIMDSFNARQDRINEGKKELIDLLRQEAEGVENASNEKLLADMDEHLGVLNALGVSRHQAVDFIRGEEIPALEELDKNFRRNGEGVSILGINFSKLMENDAADWVSKMAHDLGVSEDALRDALSTIFDLRDGWGEAKAEFAESMELENAVSAAMAPIVAMASVLPGIKGAGEDAAGGVAAFGDAAEDSAEDAKDLARSADRLEQMWDGAEQAMINAIEGITGGFGAASTAADQFRRSLQMLFSPEIDYEQWLNDVRAGIMGLGEAIDDETTSMDRSSEATIANREAFGQRLQSISDGIPVMQQMGMSTDEIAAKTQALVWDLLAAGNAAGLNQGEMAALIETYGLTPEQVQTAIELQGALETQRRLEEVRSKQDDIPPKVLTQSHAAIEEGDFAKVDRLLASLDDIPPRKMTEAEFKAAGAQQSAAQLTADILNVPDTSETTGNYHKRVAAAHIAQITADILNVPGTSETTAYYYKDSAAADVASLVGSIFGVPDSTTTDAYFNDNASSGIYSLNSAIASVDRTITITANYVGGALDMFAGGTDYAPGGMAIVGEDGPELMYVPRGSRIWDAQESRSMMSARDIGYAPQGSTSQSWDHSRKIEVGTIVTDRPKGVQDELSDLLWKAGV